MCSTSFHISTSLIFLGIHAMSVCLYNYLKRHSFNSMLITSIPNCVVLWNDSEACKLSRKFSKCLVSLDKGSKNWARCCILPSSILLNVIVRFVWSLLYELKGCKIWNLDINVFEWFVNMGVIVRVNSYFLLEW